MLLCCLRRGREVVFENETQPDARRASESTTFKLRACLRWRRMPTLTVACSEALKLAGAEGSELVSLGSCSPVKPPPPSRRLGCESCDARVLGAQPCTRIGRFPVGRPSATHSRRYCQISPSLCIQRISMQPGGGGKPGKAEMSGEHRRSGKYCPGRTGLTLRQDTVLCVSPKPFSPSPLEHHISFIHRIRTAGILPGHWLRALTLGR